MAADQATLRDTGLLHAQAFVPATHTPTSDVPLVHVPVVDARAEHRLVEDDPEAHRLVVDVREAVARAAPDKLAVTERPPYGGLFCAQNTARDLTAGATLPAPCHASFVDQDRHRDECGNRIDPRDV